MGHDASQPLAVRRAAIYTDERRLLPTGGTGLRHRARRGSGPVEVSLGLAPSACGGWHRHQLVGLPELTQTCRAIAGHQEPSEDE